MAFASHSLLTTLSLPFTSAARAQHLPKDNFNTATQTWEVTSALAFKPGARNPKNWSLHWKHTLTGLTFSPPQHSCMCSHTNENFAVRSRNSFFNKRTCRTPVSLHSTGCCRYSKQFDAAWQHSSFPRGQSLPATQPKGCGNLPELSQLSHYFVCMCPWTYHDVCHASGQTDRQKRIKTYTGIKIMIHF